MRYFINTILSLALSLAVILGPHINAGDYNWNKNQSNVIVQPPTQSYYQADAIDNNKPVSNTQYELPTKANADAQADASKIRHNSISKGTIYTVAPTYDNVTGPGMFINQ